MATFLDLAADLLVIAHCVTRCYAGATAATNARQPDGLLDGIRK